MGNTHQNCTCKPPKITSLKVRAYTSTFANLDLDVYEKKDRDSNLHLLVKRYRDGTMTPRLHDLNIGQLKILFETFGNLRPLIIYFRTVYSECIFNKLCSLLDSKHGSSSVQSDCSVPKSLDLFAFCGSWILLSSQTCHCYPS